jgi:hypothetical protein
LKYLQANVFVYVTADAVTKNSRRIVLVTNVTTTVQMYDISVRQVQNTIRLFGKVKVKDMMIHTRVSRVDGILPYVVVLYALNRKHRYVHDIVMFMV